MFRPTWAEIDLDVIQSNLRRFRSKLSRNTKLMFVVKGNAYGHGAVEVSRAAEACGAASWFGVSSVEEGITLREAGIRLPILILGSLYPFESFRVAAEHDLTPTVASLEAARRLVETVRKPGASSMRCHIKLDTGMGRIGMSWPSGLGAVRYVAEHFPSALEGVYTHFACAESNRAIALAQIRRFKEALRDIRKEGIAVLLRHAANSAAALGFSASRFDMVRPGLAIYGLFGKDFEPALRLKSRIIFIKNVKSGTPISYEGTFKTRRKSRIATLPVGYADGFPRILSNRARVLVHGRRCPVVGAVTMDMTMVDVTDVPQVRVGDEVTLIGRCGREEIRASELARLAQTIPYEIVTQISARVPRLYHRNAAANKKHEQTAAAGNKRNIVHPRSPSPALRERVSVVSPLPTGEGKED